jgi:hypothetical protein
LVKARRAGLENFNSFAHFFECLNLFLKNNQSVRTFEIIFMGNPKFFAEYLLSHKHGMRCISGTLRFPEFLPVKIVTNLDWLTENIRFPESVEYLAFRQVPYDGPIENGWQMYQTYFANFPNLRGISLNHHSEEAFLSLRLGREHSRHNQEIWRERILYLKNVLNIRIMLESEILNNEELELELLNQALVLAKDSGHRWYFRFE